MLLISETFRNPKSEDLVDAYAAAPVVDDDDDAPVPFWTEPEAEPFDEIEHAAALSAMTRDQDRRHARWIACGKPARNIDDCPMPRESEIEADDEPFQPSPDDRGWWAPREDAEDLDERELWSSYSAWADHVDELATRAGLPLGCVHEFPFA